MHADPQIEKFCRQAISRPKVDHACRLPGGSSPGIILIEIGHLALDELRNIGFLGGGLRIKLSQTCCQDFFVRLACPSADTKDMSLVCINDDTIRLVFAVDSVALLL